MVKARATADSALLLLQQIRMRLLSVMRRAKIPVIAALLELNQPKED